MTTEINFLRTSEKISPVEGREFEINKFAEKTVPETLEKIILKSFGYLYRMDKRMATKTI